MAELAHDKPVLRVLTHAPTIFACVCICVQVISHFPAGWRDSAAVAQRRKADDAIMAHVCTHLDRDAFTSKHMRIIVRYTCYGTEAES